MKNLCFDIFLESKIAFVLSVTKNLKIFTYKIDLDSIIIHRDTIYSLDTFPCLIIIPLLIKISNTCSTIYRYDLISKGVSLPVQTPPRLFALFVVVSSKFLSFG